LSHLRHKPTHTKGENIGYPCEYIENIYNIQIYGKKCENPLTNKVFTLSTNNKIRGRNNKVRELNNIFREY